MSDLSIINDDAFAALNGIRLGDLSAEQLNRVLGAAAVGKLAAEALSIAGARSENFDQLLADFLETRRSVHTRVRYAAAIRLWREFLAKNRIHPLLATPKEADLFSASLTGAAATVNSNIAAVSSFYKTLYKWGKIDKTPFIQIGRRAPEAVAYRIPTAVELKTILSTIEAAKRSQVHYFKADTDTRASLLAAVKIMAYRGFRVGALGDLVVDGDRFRTKSKGKAWTGILPTEAVKAVEGRGARPFQHVPQSTIQTLFSRFTKRLFLSGAIRHPYSVHDLRHYFASVEYAKDHDIVRVSKALNHSDIKITVAYLHELGTL
jgi:integrase